jgi:CHASE2 domain-containing sensor protein
MRQTSPRSESGSESDRAAQPDGRRAALVVLGLLLLVRAFDPAPVSALRLELFDLYQRLAPRAAPPSVVIVDIGDAALARYGQWPWPRGLMARLVDAIADGGARAVGIDILFPEPDRLSARSFAEAFPTIDPALRRGLEALPDGDRALAASFARLPVVLGAAVDAQSPTDDQASARPALPPAPPLAEGGADPRPYLPHLAGLVRNLDLLTAAAAGTGIVSLPLEPDGVIRRLPAAVAIGDTVLPALALEMARVAGGGQALAIETGHQGIERVGFGTRMMPAERDGRIWIHYAATDPARYIPAADLLDGTVAADRLRGRLVLIGATAAGLMDLRPTPLGLPVPGVEIHAQLLENLLDGHVLARPAPATLGELALCLVFAGAIIVLQPRLAARWLVALWALGAAAILLAAWIAYDAHLLLLDGAFPAAAATIVYVVLLAAGFVAARRRAEAALREREARLRALQTELLDVSRRSAVAQLSSALAHELNQPLSAIGNYVQACRRMLTSADDRASEKVYGYMDRAVAQVDRAAAIIAGLRDIVERGRTARAPEDANQVLEEAVATALLGAGPAAVAVQQRYAPDLKPVLINRIQIQQVVLNLVRNAVEAMAGMPRRVLTVETRAAEDGGVEAAISDTGPGLAPEVEARLFRPVVSTKEAGMGVGLSICRSIIDTHGGRLWAARNADGGTTFRFTLPPVIES